MALQTDFPETPLIHHCFRAADPQCNPSALASPSQWPGKGEEALARTVCPSPVLFQLLLIRLLCSMGNPEPLTFSKLSQLFSANELNYLALYLRCT